MSIDNLVHEGDVVAFSSGETPQPLIIRKEFFQQYAGLIELSKKLERELQVYMAGNYHEGCPVIEKLIAPNMGKVVIATAKRSDDPSRGMILDFPHEDVDFSKLSLLEKFRHSWFGFLLSFCYSRKPLNDVFMSFYHDVINFSDLSPIEKFPWGLARLFVSKWRFNRDYSLSTMDGKYIHPERLRNKNLWHLLISENFCYDSGIYQDWAEGRARKERLEIMGFSHIEPLVENGVYNHCFDQEIRFANKPFIDDYVPDISIYLKMVTNTEKDWFYVAFDVTGGYSIIRLNKELAEKIDGKTGGYFTGDKGRHGFEYEMYLKALQPEMFYEVRPKG